MPRFALALALCAILPCLALADDKKRGETPEDAYNAMMESILAGKLDETWEFFSEGSRKLLADQMGEFKTRLESVGDEEKAQVAEAMGVTLEDLEKLTNEELARKMVKAQFLKLMGDEEAKKKMKGTKWKSGEVKGDRAVCVTVEADGTTDTIVMLKEKGIWRLDLPETEKLKNAEPAEDEGDDEDEEE